MEPKKVFFVNGRFLTQKITGVQRFAREILLAYSNLGNTCVLIVLVPKDCLIDRLYGFEVKKIGKYRSHLWEQIDLPLFLKRNCKNVGLLNLTNTAPLFYSNNIVTIHDLAFRLNPYWFSYFFRTFYNFLIPKIAQKAQHVITVSHTMKNQLIEQLNIRAENISVIYNAVPYLFSNGPTSKKVSYERYALTVGSLDPRKNLPMLINAFLSANIKDLKLYIVGERNKSFNFDYTGHNSENIIFLGRVSDKELINYYSNAQFFIYLSLYEGFGIPNIEAMKMGIPVLTSNIPIMREICKDAAVFANPTEINDIKEKVLLLNGDKRLRKKLSIQGYNVQKQYSWKKSAQTLAKIVERSFS